MYETPTAPLTIGQVLDKGFGLFKAGFASVWGFALLGAVSGIPFYSVNSAVTAAGPEAVLGMLGPQLITLLLNLLVTLFTLAAISLRLDAIAHGRSLTIGQTVTIAVSRALPLLGTAIVYCVCVVIGMVLLVIPGVWITIAWIYGLYAVVLDRKGPIEGLGYSYALVRGHWWRTAAAVTIIGIIVGVLYVLLAVVFGVLIAVGTFAATDAEGLIVILEIWILPLLQIVLLPLSYAMFVALYNDARLRHEGSDLEARIAAAE